MAAGDLETAQQQFQAGLDIVERLAAMAPGHAEWQRDLGYFRQRVADLAEGSGEGETAPGE